MADLFEASVRITPKIDPAATKAEIDKGVVSPLKASAATIASVVGTIGLAKVFSGGLTELKEQQNVLTQTTALLKANAGAANVSAQAISAFAEAEQQKTGQDKEAIQAGENLLLQFRNVKNTLGEGNDVFTQASKLALDLSAATGKDLTSAYQTLGRALQDPEQGSRALRAANVILTASQKETIKTMEDSGDVIGAQKFLLKQLQDQVGGTADAVGKTLGGQLELAKNKLDDAKASIVAGFAPAIEVAANVADHFADVMTKIPSPVAAAAGGLLALAVAARPISIVFSGLKSVLGLAADGIRAIVTRLAAMELSLGGAAIALAGVSAAIGGAVFVYSQFAAEQATATAAAAEYTKAIQKQTGEIDKNVDATTRKLLGDSDAGHILRDAGANADIFTAAIKNQHGELGNLSAVANSNNAISTFEAGMKSGGLATTDLTSELQRLIESGKLSDGQLRAVAGALVQVNSEYAKGKDDASANAYFTGQAGAAAAGAAGDQSDLADSTDAATGASTQQTEAQKLQAAQMQAVTDHAKEQQDALDKLADAQQNLLGGTLSYGDATRAVGQAQRDLDQVQRDHAQAVRDAAKAQTDYNTVLKDPKASPADRADALARLQDAQRRASPQQLADDEANARSKLEQAIDHQASSYADLQEKQAAANGQTFDATQKLDAYKGKLDELIGQHPQVAADLDDLATKINNLPDKKTIILDVHGNITTSPFPSDFGQQIAQDIGDSGSKATEGYRDPDTGGRATGGYVGPGSIHPITEGGVPESLTVNGRQYLLMPSNSSGYVNPIMPGTTSGPGGIAMSTYHPGESNAADGLIARLSMGSDARGEYISEHPEQFGLATVGGNLYTQQEARSLQGISIYVSNPDPMSAAREVAHSLLQAAPGLHGRQAA
jgi:hypothetical protein